MLSASSNQPEGADGPSFKCLPIWSCSGRGLPCPRCRHRGGGLLPRRFTLTPMLPSRRFVFCGPIPGILSRSPLATSLPCGVRTFLHPDITSGQRSSHLASASHYIYCVICKPVCLYIFLSVYVNDIIPGKCHQ